MINAQDFVKVIQHITFGILLRTFDSYGDLNFGLHAFTTNNYLIGCLILSPVLVNIGFTLNVWRRSSFDSLKAKRWTWIFVLLNLWPQYQVLKLLKAIISKNVEKDWKIREDKLERQLLFIEPWLEAIPQFFSSVSVFVLLYARDRQNIFNTLHTLSQTQTKDDLNNNTFEEILSHLGGISFANLSV